jgi:hypothetical protein
MSERPPSKKSGYAHFDDEGLEQLHSSDPHREFSLGEIAQAAGTNRQRIFIIEQRALRKLRDEFLRRGIYF